MKRKLLIAAAVLLMLQAADFMIVKTTNKDSYDNQESQFAQAVMGGKDISSINSGDWMRDLEHAVWVDVDFDGVEDLLVPNGSTGSQESATYSCFLRRGDTFEYCESFEQILNPAVDQHNQIILSIGGNAASSRSWTKYIFADNEFIMLDQLTVYPQFDSGHIIWKYHIQARKDEGNDGLESIRMLDITDETDKLYIYEHILTDEGNWAIDSDIWKGLHKDETSGREG